MILESFENIFIFSLTLEGILPLITTCSTRSEDDRVVYYIKTKLESVFSTTCKAKISNTILIN